MTTAAPRCPSGWTRRGNWIWADDPEFPLDDSTVQGILALLTDLRPQQTITEGDTLEAYGLGPAFATLTATRPDGGTLTVALGNTTTDGDSYYMLPGRAGESGVYHLRLPVLLYVRGPSTTCAGCRSCRLWRRSASRPSP